MSADKRARILLVTGMSGAGRSAALAVLEDLGYEAIDNLPLSLLGRLLHRGGEGGLEAGSALAVDADIRTRGFRPDTLIAEIAALRARDDLTLTLVFFDCDDEVLRRRFTETRRRHPLAENRPLIDGIRHERQLLAGLRDSSELVVDTTDLTTAMLRALLGGHFRLKESPQMTTSVISFAYGRGVPREADLVIDVRFLANPHYEERLRPLTGLDDEVGEYIAADARFTPFFDRLAALIVSLLPHYAREGKTYLTLAFGCTGGRHRSVYVARRFAALLEGEGRPVDVRHRDIGARA